MPVFAPRSKSPVQPTRASGLDLESASDPKAALRGLGYAAAQQALSPDVSKLIARKDEAALCRIADQEPGRLAGATWQQCWAVVDLLQCGPTGPAEERGIRNVLAGAGVADRAAILKRIDQNPDHHDVEELVYHDIDDPAVRAEVKALIDETAALSKPLGVISDFDDTVVPHYDKRYGKEFPGARDFYSELLSQGAGGNVHWVTARPELVAGGVRGKLEKRGMPKGALETGSLSKLVFEGEPGIYAEKVSDIRKIMELHPGQRFVLIGDDSQQDPHVYAAIQKEFPQQVAAVFIRRTGRADSPELPAIQYVDDYHQASALWKGGQSDQR